MFRLHVWMEGPSDSNWEHRGQSEPELGPEALGTSHPTAPEFAGEQMELRELESFVHAARWLAANWDSGLVSGIHSLSLPSPVLSYSQTCGRWAWSAP